MKIKSYVGLLLVAIALQTFVSTGFAQAQAPAPVVRDRQWPPGTLNRLEDLPAHPFKERVQQLSPAARQRALARLQSIHFTELDLDAMDVDAEGGIYFVDHFTIELTTTESELTTGEASVPVSPFPPSLILHSHPGAPNVLYLDFDGENVSGTAWNTLSNRTTFFALPYSADSDFTTFSDSEQTAIKHCWQRVAEDYAPFNIDVTTERPATFNNRTAHALITRNTDANGKYNPHADAGGVAYLNYFNSSSYSTHRPAWIYNNNLSNNESYIAEAVSHEIGHNMGLSHDGKTDGTEYYSGHGSGDISWGPIMGTGYDRNVSQWSKGEYYLANNTEDDLAIIAGKCSYRADDHGNTSATATPLVVTGGTNIVSTTPENDPANTNPANKGVLEQRTDVDVFSFFTSGSVSLSVNPWLMDNDDPFTATTRGGNLDVLLELRDAAGTLLLTNNVANETGASIATNLPEGSYFLHVRNTGTGNPLASTPTGYTAYASIGQYFISGSIAPLFAYTINQGAITITGYVYAGSRFDVTSVVIPATINGYPVKRIGDAAFSDYYFLSSVTIPNSVTNIGNSAFYSSGLTSVTIPNSVTSIGGTAFSGCSSLTSVVIGNSVTSIGDSAFGNSGLTSVTIPNSVTSIGDEVFRYCYNLTNVVIGTSVTSIGDLAFVNCSSLASVVIPNSVTNIGVSAFNSCASLTNVVIGTSVTSIGTGAFRFCSGLAGVVIGNSVTSIETYAFGNCVSLTSLTIPNSVTSIGTGAFYSCVGLTSVMIGNSVTSIGDHAFVNCSGLTSVVIPNSVTSIEAYAFDNCSSLTNFTFLGNAPSLGSSAFTGGAMGAKVYYYYGTAGWGTTYGGLPTVMLGSPTPQIGGSTAGIQSGNFSFIVAGVTGQTVVIEASTNLVNWQPIWTNTLFGLSTNFTDSQWANYPSRFYRAR